MVMIVLFLLMGCTSLPKPPVKPANLISPCPGMKEFKGKDMGDLLRYTVALTKDYKICSAKQKALSEI